jgi:hypothetical protein
VPTATPTPVPTPLPTPRIGPVDAGMWRITVTTTPASDPVYYPLRCAADGTIVVDNGNVSQDFYAADLPAQAGWTANTLTFMDGCDLVDGVSWCIYYDMTVQSPTSMTGTCFVVGPDNQFFPFEANAVWVSP